MSTLTLLAARGGSVLTGREINFGQSDTTLNLLIAFLGIAFFALCLVALLVLLRRMKRQRQMTVEDGLPQYHDIEHRDGRNTNRLTIQTADGRSSILLVNGRPMLADPHSPPHSPNNVPEIHITFPDEQDDQGRQRNGRVLVVRVGETSIGLEPVNEEQLPAYEKESKHGFYSIDMNQIGGLKEKDRSQFS